MKKTKVIVKKDSKKSTKQKQKQSVNVNVHIDQSKRSTQRKPKLKPDSAVGATTTLPHGENYVKSYIPSLPPVLYQQPQLQNYGNLQPVNNISDAMIRAIRSDQYSNGYHPNYNPHGNSIGQSIENQKYKDETDRKSANAIVQFIEDYVVDEPDENVEIKDVKEHSVVTPLTTSPPPPTTLSSSPPPLLESNEPQIFASAKTEYNTLGKTKYRAKLLDNKITNMNEMRKIANSLALDSSQRREFLLPLIMKKLNENN